MIKERPTHIPKDGPAMSRQETAETKATQHRHWTHAWRFLRWRQRPQSVPWGSIVVVLLLALALPTAIDIWLSHVWPTAMIALQTLVSTVYAVTSVMIIWEACAAWRSPEPAPTADSEVPPLPHCTAVVAAYLPNEQDIIVETLQHILSTSAVPPDRLEVILAYNTPEPLEIEHTLRQMADADPRLRLLPVAGSRSKAENVNAAVRKARGEILGIFDADHRPAPDCFHRAWRWLWSGYDVVQGRCVIRNGPENWLTRTIAVEFDCIYAVSHQGRSTLSRTAIFGGSNGYWRRSALLEHRMNPAMLTEDIDVSVRALLGGCRLIHDRDIVSEELAPTRLKHWLFQRKRWSQGWLEVTLRHQRALNDSRRLNPWQKVLWFYLLVWGACFPLISLQVVPLVLTALIRGWSIPWLDSGYFFVTSILTLASGPVTLLLTYLRVGRLRRGQAVWYLLYGIIGLFYTSLKTLVTLVAQYSHFLKDRQWVTTPR
jgi:cellulose synthase/poly-beta-1,6-N-acetylglucosamine synthase-like glycosyltransferase